MSRLDLGDHVEIFVLWLVSVVALALALCILSCLNYDGDFDAGRSVWNSLSNCCPAAAESMPPRAVVALLGGSYERIARGAGCCIGRLAHGCSSRCCDYHNEPFFTTQCGGSTGRC